MKEKNILWELFKVFFRIGAFTVGGGYAMIPILQEEMVENYKWITEEEILDIFAIGQSTPGVIAINTATFIGYKKRGLLGALVTTMALLIPSWISIIVIAVFFNHFSENIYVQKAFMGIRIVVVVLIFNAVIKMGKKAIKNIYGICIMLTSFFLIAFMKISPIVAIIGGGLLGLILVKINVFELEKRNAEIAKEVKQ